MKNSLGNTLMIILLFVTLIIIYTIEVEGDFTTFDSKAGSKAIIYLLLPVIVTTIAGKFSKKK